MDKKETVRATLRRNRPEVSPPPQDKLRPSVDAESARAEALGSSVARSLPIGEIEIAVCRDRVVADMQRLLAIRAACVFNESTPTSVDSTANFEKLVLDLVSTQPAMAAEIDLSELLLKEPKRGKA